MQHHAIEEERNSLIDVAAVNISGCTELWSTEVDGEELQVDIEVDVADEAAMMLGHDSRVHFRPFPSACCASGCRSPGCPCRTGCRHRTLLPRAALADSQSPPAAGCRLQRSSCHSHTVRWCCACQNLRRACQVAHDNQQQGSCWARVPSNKMTVSDLQRGVQQSVTGCRTVAYSAERRARSRCACLMASRRSSLLMSSESWTGGGVGEELAFFLPRTILNSGRLGISSRMATRWQRASGWARSR